MGPTASGKTEVAERLADDLDAALINADAFQVYRGLDIGTAKPVARERYELLDIKDPEDTFGVGEFVRLAAGLLETYFTEGRNVIVVGGTGLNIRALFEEYSGMEDKPSDELREALSKESLETLVERLRVEAPQVADRIDLKNPARVQRALERALVPSPSIEMRLPPFQRTKLGIVGPTEVLDAMIVSRFERMIQNGWIDEVLSLRNQGVPNEAPGFRAIGYRPLLKYLGGELEIDAAKATVVTDTRQYAKRQRTWLRSEKNLTVLNWSDALGDARRFLNLN